MRITLTTAGMAPALRPAHGPEYPPRPRHWLESRVTIALVLLVVAFLSRAIQFGNPVVQVDEQFYLLVGDRMWHGALPYVDIWDRKPMGLFLLYAATRLLGGDGICQYQVVATLFAAATAFTVSCIADRLAPRTGALLAGVAYLLYLGMFGGDGGQSPVFYNLLVALAALCIVRVIERPAFDRAALWLGSAAMLLVGLALQVKYSAVFEGVYFGIALIAIAHAKRMRLRRIAPRALLWMGIALLPTAAAWAYYAAIGQNAAFVFANFVSIFARGTEPDDAVGVRLLNMALKLIPIAIAVGLSQWPRAAVGAATGPDRAVHRFLAGWAGAAVLGVLVFGTYFVHYALPLVAPLAIVAAPVFGSLKSGVAFVGRRRTWVLPFAAIVLVVAGSLSFRIVLRNRHNRGDGSEVRAIAAFVTPRLQGSCLFIYNGEPILYQLTHSCLPTRWAFPHHLDNRLEDGAIGVDAVAEVQRIMAGKPRLVLADGAADADMNLRTWRYMQRVLSADYRPAAAWKIGGETRIVYARRPGI